MSFRAEDASFDGGETPEERKQKKEKKYKTGKPIIGTQIIDASQARASALKCKQRYPMSRLATTVDGTCRGIML